jgi:hypothetical protein
MKLNRQPDGVDQVLELMRKRRVSSHDMLRFGAEDRVRFPKKVLDIGRIWEAMARLGVSAADLNKNIPDLSDEDLNRLKISFRPPRKRKKRLQINDLPVVSGAAISPADFPDSAPAKSMT